MIVGNSYSSLIFYISVSITYYLMDSSKRLIYCANASSFVNKFSSSIISIILVGGVVLKQATFFKYKVEGANNETVG